MSRGHKTFVVTGASSGIGRAVIECLLDADATVFGISRRPADSAVSSRPEYQHVVCDLADFDQLEAVGRNMVSQCSPCNGVILAHGYGDFAGLEEFSRADIERLIAVDLTSHILLARLFLPAMKKSGQGDLILVGSEAALKGSRKGSVYCAAKFGLRGFVQAARQECATSGVRVSMVNPGMVDTGFYDDLDFTHGDSRDNHLQAADVADAIKLILNMPRGSVVDEINLSPQKHVVKHKQIRR